MIRRFLPDPFIVGVLLTLLLATLLPVSEFAATVMSWLATAAIVLLFFFHGAKLPRESVIEGVRHWRLHLTILACTFVFFPLLALLLAWMGRSWMPAMLWTGIIYLAALPSTVQSSIAFTSMAGGNVSAAVASSSASQLLGVVLTPLLISLLAGVSGAEVPLSGLGTVLLQILAPFLAGHLLRPWIGNWVMRHKAAISITDRGTILLAVFSAFSSAVKEGIWSRLPLPALGILFVVCLVMLVIALFITRSCARLLGFAREDEIAIVFCGTKKSLIQGVPMARVLFHGPDQGLILLPIMIFHQLQLMACSWIARRYARAAKNV